MSSIESSTTSSTKPVANLWFVPKVFQIKFLSLESNSRTPASCSITSGPFKPILALLVEIKYERIEAVIDIPPNEPTRPGTIPITGTNFFNAITAF